MARGGHSSRVLGFDDYDRQQRLLGLLQALAYARGTGGVRCATDVLLLDERQTTSTFEGALWLENYLANIRIRVINHQHDRGC